MKCREVERLLTEDPELGASAEARKHLHSCQKCQEMQRELRTLNQMSAGLKNSTEAPPFFASRVCAEARKSPLSSRWRVAAVLSLTALLCVGVFNVSDFLVSEDSEEGKAVLLAGTEQKPPLSPPQVLPSLLEAGPGAALADDSVVLIVDEDSSPGYVVELPAVIEVRQTQAQNEFYMRNVSH
jgi:hypothetical protein